MTSHSCLGPISYDGFRCLLEYQGTQMVFTDLDELFLFCWQKPADEMVFWFGECPVTPIGHQFIATWGCRVLLLLPMAYTLAEFNRELLPAKIGICHFSRKHPPDIDYHFQVGLNSGPRAREDSPIRNVRFLPAASHTQTCYWFWNGFEPESGCNLFYRANNPNIFRDGGSI